MSRNETSGANETGNEMSAPAIVARTAAGGIEYLLSQHPAPRWSRTLQIATRYASVRDATRVALRLPGRFRAYALPLGPASLQLFSEAA